MSGARLRSATHHQAGLLQNKLARLDERRVRQARAAEIAFNLDLLGIVESHSPVILDMVQMALDNDPPSHGLALALRKARNPMGVVIAEDPHERPTDAAELAPPALPGLLTMTVNDNAIPRYEQQARDMVAGVQSVMGRVETPPIDGEFPEVSEPAPEPVYRYPEPGEPAVQLPDGRIVAVNP